MQRVIIQLAASAFVVALGPYEAAAESTHRGQTGERGDATVTAIAALASASGHDGMAILDDKAADSAVNVLDLSSMGDDLQGFACSLTDGTHGYLVPEASAQVVRFDLATFSKIEKLEVDEDDSELVAFISGGCWLGAGGWIYMTCGTEYSGKVARFDTYFFKKIEVLDLKKLNPDIKSFEAGFTDVVHGYVIPEVFNQGGASEDDFGKIARFPLSAEDFSSISEIETLDLKASDGKPLRGFSGGFSDGTHAYLVPFDSGKHDDEPVFSGKVVRFKIDTFSDVESLDVADVGGDAGLTGFKSGFQDGIYGYLVPYFNGQTHGKFVRFDLATFKTVDVLDLAEIDQDLKGFAGGFESNGYGYLIPYQDGDDEFRPFGKVAVIDLKNFNADGVKVIDLSGVSGDADLVGFEDGFAWGGYGYAAPKAKKKVARFELAKVPTPSPSPGGRPSGAGDGALKVVFFAALAVALAGIGYYVFFVRRNGPSGRAARSGAEEVELR